MSRLTHIVLLLLVVFSGSTFAKDGSYIQRNNLFPKVKLETSMGDIVIELDRRRAPITSNNFLIYVKEGSYDNTIFHRIIPGFMVQGGGYNLKNEEVRGYDPIFNESGNGRKNNLYTVAMARQQEPHTAKRQFFFNVNNNKHLNPGRDWGYAVFGLILQGAEVVDEMAMVETTYNPETGWGNAPVEPVILKSATILPERPVEPVVTE